MNESGRRRRKRENRGGGNKRGTDWAKNLGSSFMLKNWVANKAFIQNSNIYIYIYINYFK